MIEWVTRSDCSFPLFVIPGLTEPAPCLTRGNPVFLSLKDQKVALLEQRVSNLENGPAIRGMKILFRTRITDTVTLFEEVELYRTAFEKEKELTDRALKLAEVGKPKSNLELQELLGLAASIMDSWKEDNQYENPGIIRKIILSFWVQLSSCFRTYVPIDIDLGRLAKNIDHSADTGDGMI